MNPMLNIAIRAARKAGDLLIKYYGISDIIEVNRKSTNDFITNVDRESKRLITEVIRNSYPQHVIIVKENSKPTGDSEVQWIIDPLNGITNFIRRFPHFAVSIAIRIKDRTEAAVVYDPVRNELFTASRGQGAQLNSYRLRGGIARNLNDTILATGFLFNQKKYANNYINLLSKLFYQCADFRCTGSVVLDLAYVAAGRVDGFFEIDLEPWAFASGELLMREAGCLVTDFIGNQNHLISRNVVAGNSRIVKAILSAFCENIEPKS